MHFPLKPFRTPPRVLFYALMLSFGLFGAAAAAPLDDARAAYLHGDNAKAVALLRPLAAGGNAEAQFYLGGMIDYGLGVAKDPAVAVEWYRKSAVQGNVGAQVNLGQKYQTGQGVARSLTEALKWYRLAANTGSPMAQFNLGVVLGSNDFRNYAEAADWYRRAAEQGYIPAQLNLALLLSAGVNADHVQAYKWWTVAAAGLPATEKSKRDTAIANRDTMAAGMSRAQIAEAQKLVREFRPRNE